MFSERLERLIRRGRVHPLPHLQEAHANAQHGEQSPRDRGRHATRVRHAVHEVVRHFSERFLVSGDAQSRIGLHSLLL